jgi:histidinol-phosphate phosphatase family protein
MQYRHVILDRDGVLNHEAPAAGYIREPAEFVWLPGTLEALASLQRAGVRLSVATNQSGVGRGLMSFAQLEAVHERMRADAARNGASFAAVLFCPHEPEAGCACRKPQPGLIQAAIAGSGIPAAESIVVGDDLRDLEAAARAGVSAALVRTGKGRNAEAHLNGTKVPIYDDLPGLARALLGSDLNVSSNTTMSIANVFKEHASVTARAAEELPPVLKRVVDAMEDCLRGGHKIFACGNGGSAADAQHLVAELIGRFLHERQSLPAIALTADTAILTAVGNDYGYDRVFARQLEGLARPGDLLFAISTSGNSPNVIAAAITARARGCKVVCLMGEKNGNLLAHADPDLLIRAPSTVTARIQEVHTLCIHAIADSLDEILRHRPLS